MCFAASCVVALVVVVIDGQAGVQAVVKDALVMVEKDTKFRGFKEGGKDNTSQMGRGSG